MTPATVILTRPGDRNDALLARLHGSGVHAIAAPVLSIETLAVTPPAPRSGAIYVFVSRHAVSAYFDSVHTPWPKGAWAAAVGTATARALRQFVPADFVLAPQLSAAPDSESLLAVIDALAPGPHPVHILRAQHGRDWLADQLRQRGCTVTCHALYRRQPVVWDRSIARQLAGCERAILLVTSLEALDAIDANLTGNGFDWPARLRAVVLHQRIARRLQCIYATQARGPVQTTVSAPDDAALYQAIMAASRQPD